MGEVHSADVVDTLHRGARCWRDKEEVAVAPQIALLEGTDLPMLDGLLACEDHGEDAEETNNVGVGEIRYLAKLLM